MAYTLKWVLTLQVLEDAFVVAVPYFLLQLTACILTYNYISCRHTYISLNTCLLFAWVHVQVANDDKRVTFGGWFCPDCNP
eukprot:1415829-Pyramimonas_sp.AAC.1